MAAQTFKLYLYGIEITQTMAMTLGESLVQIVPLWN